MAVYVDKLMPCAPNEKWRWGFSCHLFADDLSELHSFANRLGLHRSWFQDKKRFPHYDLTKGKRKQAVALGAVEITLLEWMKKRKR